MMIHSTIDPTLEAPSQTPQHQMGAWVFALGLTLLAAGFIAEKAPPRSTSESLVLRCDQVSGQVGRSLVEQGIAANSAEIRRQKQLAFRACVDDYDAFKRLSGTE
jgi:hypothetical protein